MNSPLIGLQGYVPAALQKREESDRAAVDGQVRGSSKAQPNLLPSLDVVFVGCLFAVSVHITRKRKYRYALTATFINTTQRNRGSHQIGGNVLMFIFTPLQSVTIRKSVFQDNDFGAAQGALDQVGFCPLRSSLHLPGVFTIA